MAQAETFKAFTKKERARLEKDRKKALAKRDSVVQELQSIESELNAIEAYERAKGGEPKRSGKRAPGRPRVRARRGEKREAVLDLVRQHPEGLSRGEILNAMGVKGTKSAEQSVSNALSALKKAGQLDSREGRYFVV
jgi:DNA-binding transcriptional ArsR family regulator